MLRKKLHSSSENFAVIILVLIVSAKFISASALPDMLVILRQKVSHVK